MLLRTLLTATVCMTLLTISACASSQADTSPEPPQVVNKTPEPPQVTAPEPEPAPVTPPEVPAEAEPEPPAEAVVADPETPETPTVESEVVISYGDRKLTMDDVRLIHPEPTDRQIAAMTRSWLLSEVLYVEAEKRGITEQPKALFIAEMMRKKSFTMELKAQAENSVEVSDQEVRDFYESTGSIDNQNPGTLHVARFSADSLEAGREIIKRLKAGEDYETIADDQYEDIVFEGSYLRMRHRIAPALFQLASKAKADQIVGPVQIASGEYEVGKVLVNIEPKLLPFEQVKDSITSRLKRRKADQAFKDLVSDLREKADAEIQRSPRLIKIENQLQQAGPASRRGAPGSSPLGRIPGVPQ